MTETLTLTPRPTRLPVETDLVDRLHALLCNELERRATDRAAAAEEAGAAPAEGGARSMLGFVAAGRSRRALFRSVRARPVLPNAVSVQRRAANLPWQPAG